MPRRRPADLLELPLVGRLLRWRHARIALQVPVLGVAALVIFDGLTGPQIAPLNLAGVVPWIHWRGLIIIGLLVAANFFCMSCPFMLPRKPAKILFRPQRVWPRFLRSKWIAVALLVLFFWAYEAFGLWNSPWWTAWIAVGYFTAAMVIDGLFRDAPFCKYLCPAGQFQMVQSLTSPMEVRVRDMSTCRSCRTNDCIRGREGIPGCELHLFQPRKAGNLDCTFCLDCIHTCPHDNVGILYTLPGGELWRDRLRSGIGRFRKRTDVAAMVLVLVFAAYANAAGMIAPVMRVRRQFLNLLPTGSMPLVLGAAFLAVLVILPFVCVSLAAAVTRRVSAGSESLRSIACRYTYALLPMGASMWVAHYSFHLFTSADALFPAVHRFLGTWSWRSAAPAISMSMPQSAAGGGLLRWEILCLDAGLLLSLYAAYRIGLEREQGIGRSLLAGAPWAVLCVVLFIVGVWILFQPMQMRGMMAGAG
jgi:polyferredoxin